MGIARAGARAAFGKQGEGEKKDGEESREGDTCSAHVSKMPIPSARSLLLPATAPAFLAATASRPCFATVTSSCSRIAFILACTFLQVGSRLSKNFHSFDRVPAMDGIRRTAAFTNPLSEFLFNPEYYIETALQKKHCCTEFTRSGNMSGNHVTPSFFNSCTMRAAQVLQPGSSTFRLSQ